MDKKTVSTSPDRSGRGKGKAAAIDDEVQNHLGRQLQSIYDDVLHQPVPERFMSLLRELDEAAQKNAAQGGTTSEKPAEGSPLTGSPLTGAGDKA